MKREHLLASGIEKLLFDHPGLRLVPSSSAQTQIAGTIAFRCTNGVELVEDTFEIEISLPDGFPKTLPLVREVGGRIPRDFHTNQSGALCLGAPIRLRIELANDPNLPSFVEKCVIPFFYGRSIFEKCGRMPFEELAHGVEGIRNDFATLFDVTNAPAAELLVWLTSMKRRLANKYTCPCGSSEKLGRCKHHFEVNRLRSLLGRSTFRDQYQWLKSSNLAK